MSLHKIETEAKFVVPDPSTFAALQKLSQLGDFELKPIGVKTVVDRYLDTADKRLYQAGVACRLRKVNQQQLVTLKSLTPAEGNLHRREEIETEVTVDPLQISQPRAWPEGRVKKLVLEIVGSAPLETLFILHQTRHQFHALRQGQPVLELSLDEVSLRDQTVVDYRELEAELIESGVEANLISFVEALRARWPLKVETQSKFERALLEIITGPSTDLVEDTEKVSDTEKSLLENIARGPAELLSKRAIIILMTDNGSSVANIAKEVSFTPRTVRRWQRDFARKRLNIFPERILDGYQHLKPVRTEVIAAEPETTTQTTRPKKAKKPTRPFQWLQRESVIEYPLREKIGLEPADSLAEAGRKVLGFHFGRMLTHEPGTRLGSDIEALHDMRVATRRMRAAFRVFGSGFTKKASKPLIARLRATGRALGQVRDLDVFVEKLHHYQQSLPEGEQAGLQPLLERWLVQREQARQEMLAYLDSGKYLKFKQDFLEFVTTAGLGAKPIPVGVPTPYQLRHLVPGLIYERYEAVHAFEVVLDHATLDMLHQLRITFKQLRYALEFFAEILGVESQRVIQEVKALQDHLGELNDARVACDLLRGFLAEWDQNQWHLPLAERQSPTCLVAYLETKLEERQRLIATFPQAWAHFNHPDSRRNLALAISVL
jgi:CHAD domain-containing protein/uncharacterized protein YjbK/transposase-like protein